VGIWKIRVAKSLAFVAYVGEKWMEIKNPQNHAAVKSFRENSSKGMLKGRHNAREFHDYLFAFEKGAEYGREQLKEELTKLRADLEKQTNARKSEETARMYYVEQVNKLRTALDESIKVIQFYGDEKNWRDIVAEESFGTYCGLTEGCFDSIIYEDCENDIGGKTAREFLSKHKELIKGEV
jgi:hypothetical protein